MRTGTRCTSGLTPRVASAGSCARSCKASAGTSALARLPVSPSWRLERGHRLRKIAREGGDPFAIREQVFNTVHPEVTAAVDEALDLLRKAGVTIDEAARTRHPEHPCSAPARAAAAHCAIRARDHRLASERYHDQRLAT